MGRWVCLRCFEASDDSLSACDSCGLPRGAQPGPDEVPVPAGGSATNPRGTLVSLLLRFWWILPVVAIGIGGVLFNAQRGDDGQVSRSGDMQVNDLRVGDCYDLKEDGAESVDDVTARPCSEPHEYELMFVGTMPGDAYPADAAFEAWLEANCLPAFGEYVGMDYQSSALDIAWFSPTEEGWDEGDHAVQCAVYDPADGQLTAQLRGSRR
jgi:hypothetical protein